MIEQYQNMADGREWLSMFKQDAHRLPPAQDPEYPLVLPIWADDSAFRMVDGDIMEQSRRLARAGQGGRLGTGICSVESDNSVGPRRSG